MVDVKGFKRDNQEHSNGFIKKVTSFMLVAIVLILLYYLGMDFLNILRSRRLATNTFRFSLPILLPA